MRKHNSKGWGQRGTKREGGRGEEREGKKRRRGRGGEEKRKESDYFRDRFCFWQGWI